MTDLNPWDRQPGESAKAFAAFVLYRGMGKDRSLDAVQRTCNKSAGLIGRWSRTWGWVKRAASWDAFLDRTVTQPAEIDHARLLNEELVGPDGCHLREVAKATRETAASRKGTSQDRKLYFDRAVGPQVQTLAQTGKLVVEIVYQDDDDADD